ncbi:MAG: diguanylate cyclase, partial [Lachnospiraceae bacterium]|nr:diguanylate cyclase [Lachnospiraceae bacterium]
MGDCEYTSKDFNQKYIMNGFSSMPGGFFVYRATGEEEILYANKAFLDLFECQNADEFRLLTGGTFRGLVHPEDVDVVENSIASQVDGNRDRFDHVFYRIITKSGKEKYIEDFGHLVEDEEDGLIFYVFVVETRTKYYSFDIDELTGLPGRRRFLEFAERILEISRNANGEKPVSFIYFNLTNFKPYNRKFGISEGDNFLNQFTEILNHEFTEDFVSRFSEDHFVVCCSTGNLEEKLRQIYLNFMESERSNTVGLKMG